VFFFQDTQRSQPSPLEALLKSTPPIAFTSFMTAYQDMVFTTAVRLVADTAEAQNISQDVFLRAYLHFSDLEHSPTAGGWLKTVARHLALNHLSRHKKRWRLFSDYATEEEAHRDIDQHAYVSDTLGQDLDLQSEHGRIEYALAQLPKQERIPLVLFHFEDMSYQDIADTLHCSLGKVKTDIHRGRAKLASLLSHTDWPAT
jgi:RNA polymerase sigma-70 factor (ECF subfamily)